MLDAHPQLSIPPETGFLPRAICQAGFRSEANRRAFADVLIGHPPNASGWRDFGIPEHAFREAVNALENFSTAAGVRCFYTLYAQRFGKPRWGDKTPTYFAHLHAIERVLPEARFIHLIRDGRDTALSLRDLWFSPGKDMTTLARAWRKDVSIARQEGRRVRHYLEIRYEALIQNPAAALRKICEFIELEYDAQMLRYHVHAQQRLEEHTTRISNSGEVLVTQEYRLAQQRLVMSAPDASRVFGWKTALGAPERAAFEREAGALLAVLGYETG